MKSIHIISDVEGRTNEEKQRFGFAKTTFRNLLDFGVIPVYIKDEELPRTSKDIGDERTLPFVKDLISIGIERFSPDIIFLSNADTCMSQSLVSEVSDKLQYRDCCYAKRRNFAQIEQEISPNKIGEGKLESYGVDLFVFTSWWWNEYKDYYPDCLIGVHKWDILLSDLMAITTPGAELKDVIYHKEHEYYWSKSSNIVTNNGQYWNTKVSSKVYSKYRMLRLLAGMMRGEIDKDFGVGSCNYELGSIYQQEKNLLTYFCDSKT